MIRLRTAVCLALLTAGAWYGYRRRAGLRRGLGNFRVFDMPSAGFYDSVWGRLLEGLYRDVAFEIRETCPSGEALEIGSGPGRLAVGLAGMAPGLAVSGMDVSAEMVDLARKAARARGLDGRIDFQVADAASLPFADGRFDVVFATLVFHHLPDPLAALTEIHRVLKPGAKALVYDVPDAVWRLMHGGVGYRELIALSPFRSGSVEVVSWPPALPLVRRLVLTRPG